MPWKRYTGRGRLTSIKKTLLMSPAKHIISMARTHMHDGTLRKNPNIFYEICSWPFDCAGANGGILAGYFPIWTGGA